QQVGVCDGNHRVMNSVHDEGWLANGGQVGEAFACELLPIPKSHDLGLRHLRSKAQLSKLGDIFNKANSPPRITARRGGRAIKKILRSIRFLQRQNSVPIERTRNTTPTASIRRLRAIFLVTPPPLLAVMRGGEFAFFKMTPLNHICFLSRSGRASERFPQSNLDSCSSKEGRCAH